MGVDESSLLTFRQHEIAVFLISNRYDIVTSRKQTQIAERETAILKIAGEIIEQEGFDALTMERVLARVDFSKGTLYNHFTCREDLLVAFHAQCFNEHLVFFERGALFRGRPRERFLAAGMGHDIMHMTRPQRFRMGLTEEVLAAASDRWRETFLLAHREMMGVFGGIVRDAIATGDLPVHNTPELLVSAVWALSHGVDELHESGLIFRGVPLEEYKRHETLMFEALLNGFGWRPLSTEHDYRASELRILQEVFPAEARALGLIPATGG
jgi:AcrR family transcriptional regulator